MDLSLIWSNLQLIQNLMILPRITVHNFNHFFIIVFFILTNFNDFSMTLKQIWILVILQKLWEPCLIPLVVLHTLFKTYLSWHPQSRKTMVLQLILQNKKLRVLYYIWRSPQISFSGILFWYMGTIFLTVMDNLCQELGDSSTTSMKPGHLISDRNYNTNMAQWTHH